MIRCTMDMAIDENSKCAYCCYYCSEKESCKERCHGLDLWKCEEAIAITCVHAS